MLCDVTANQGQGCHGYRPGAQIFNQGLTSTQVLLMRGTPFSTVYEVPRGLYVLFVLKRLFALFT